MKLYTFSAVSSDGDVDVFVIQSEKKPTIHQAIRMAYELEANDPAIMMIKDSYSLEVKPANIITFNGKFQW
jgi:hypothetical protein